MFAAIFLQGSVQLTFVLALAAFSGYQRGRAPSRKCNFWGVVRGQEAARSLSWGGRNPHGPISHLPRLLPAAHSNRTEQLIVALLLS